MPAAPTPSLIIHALNVFAIYVAFVYMMIVIICIKLKFLQDRVMSDIPILVVVFFFLLLFLTPSESYGQPKADERLSRLHL